MGGVDTGSLRQQPLPGGKFPEQALALGEHVRVAVEQYFDSLDGHSVCGLYALVMSEVEKPLIKTVLERNGHNQCRSAKALGMSRSTLRKKMDRYRLHQEYSDSKVRD